MGRSRYLPADDLASHRVRDARLALHRLGCQPDLLGEVAPAPRPVTPTRWRSGPLPCRRGGWVPGTCSRSCVRPYGDVTGGRKAFSSSIGASDRALSHARQLITRNSVNGHQDLPVGGHQTSRPTDNRNPGGRTADLRVKLSSAAPPPCRRSLPRVGASHPRPAPDGRGGGGGRRWRWQASWA